MSITNNILAAFRAGVSTIQEDKQIMDEIANNGSFSELLDVMDEVDAIDGLDEMRNEFNETVDNIKYDNYDINIR